MARSLAFQEFLPILRTSRELVSIERRNYADPPPVNQQDAVRGLRGGAAVLMVAGFEAYLDDALVQFVEYARDYNPPINFALLPSAVRIQNNFTTLELAINGPRFGPTGTRESRLPAIQTASSLVSTGTLNPDAFGGTAGNPGKESLKALLKSVGMSNVYAEMKPRFESKWGTGVSNTFIGDKLDEIVRRRHQVAHRADALTISRVDLREGVKFLRALAETIDIELGYHFRQMCRTAR